uniref:Uncharacterized protein n=1 Tax=Rhodococcus sp. NS1 TaxID=402236 RepID=A0A097SQD8_9NOCA|nr:hypothetical protein LRS1606.307 [Rhodococcus sp. NS1]
MGTPVRIIHPWTRKHLLARLRAPRIPVVMSVSPGPGVRISTILRPAGMQCRVAIPSPGAYLRTTLPVALPTRPHRSEGLVDSSARRSRRLEVDVYQSVRAGRNSSELAHTRVE